MRTFAGIDTHKDTLAMAVVDDAGRDRGSRPSPLSALRGWPLCWVREDA
jgi:hypothetical protein